ncbi:hypothetical protein GCM10023310_27370 [Paenibacillus vulneris]|uniref:SDR family oxidoreductase n=1 Tax=Paenibacillus vulneris TaxID=1133364 RepID=A0ABW3US31_9BACL
MLNGKVAINHVTPGFISHGTAKGAINSFVRYLAHELGPYNITANTLSPDIVDTDATKDMPTEQKEQTAFYTPLGKIAAPEDIAKAILFYASDQIRRDGNELIRYLQATHTYKFFNQQPFQTRWIGCFYV